MGLNTPHERLPGLSVRAITAHNLWDGSGELVTASARLVTCIQLPPASPIPLLNTVSREDSSQGDLCNAHSTGTT